MSKRNKPNEHRDANFIACFLVHGAIPIGESDKLYTYKQAVRTWWADMNANMNPPIKVAARYRFWNRYHRWYENMMTTERRTDRVVAHIVGKWTQ